MPKVSVIIPVHNTASFLRRCLDSVAGQTLQDIEIICVNDASPDEASAILHEYAMRDNRMRIIEFAENKGVSVARNTGMDAANGEYIGFVDGDDYIDLDFYEKLYHAAEGGDCAKGALKMIDVETGLEIPSDGSTINDKIREHKAYFFPYFCTALYKTKLLRKNKVKFPENVRYFEDPYFIVKFLLFAESLTIIDDVYYYYIKQPKSATMQKRNAQTLSYVIESSSNIIAMINKHCKDKKHYSIIYYNLIKNLTGLYSNINIQISEIRKMITPIINIYEKCIYKEECFLNYYDIIKGENSNKTINSYTLKLLRNRIKDNLRRS